MMVTQRKHMQMKTQHTYFSIVEKFRQLSGLFATQASRPLIEILHRIFPGRPIPELIQVIPSLSQFSTPEMCVPPHMARREAKPGSTPSPSPEAHPGGTGTKSIALEYGDNSFSGVNLRIIPATVVWDMAVEWEKWPFKPQTEWDTLKVLGGPSRRSDEE